VSGVQCACEVGRPWTWWVASGQRQDVGRPARRVREGRARLRRYTAASMVKRCVDVDVKTLRFEFVLVGVVWNCATSRTTPADQSALPPPRRAAYNYPSVHCVADRYAVLRHRRTELSKFRPLTDRNPLIKLWRREGSVTMHTVTRFARRDRDAGRIFDSVRLCCHSSFHRNFIV